MRPRVDGLDPPQRHDDRQATQQPAAATSLPQISTGLNSVKEGDFKLALGDISGGKAFPPVLLLLAVLVSGVAVPPTPTPPTSSSPASPHS